MKIILSVITILFSTTILLPGQAAAQAQPTAWPPQGILPLWTYTTHSTRDGSTYSGTMVGRDPFTDAGTAAVPVFLVPLIFTTHTLGASFNSSSGAIGTQPGDATLDPTAPSACYAAPNNIPVKLIAESPLFEPAPFTFGGTSVGNTQYVDAFQRANFWSALGANQDRYHTLLSPVHVLDPITVDVPPSYGLAITNPLLLGSSTTCVPLGLIDGNWFLNYLTDTIVPSLAAKGVNPTNLPIFVSTVASWLNSVTNVYSSGFSGIHGLTGFPFPTQTYILASIRHTASASSRDTVPLSHEIGEWMNDPWVYNVTPLWGHTGPVPGCQGNLEVGDPLSFTTFSVPMPNGYAYQVQEMAFFSWFFGAPSVGVNNWFSNRGTFLTDAGPPCQK